MAGGDLLALSTPVKLDNGEQCTCSVCWSPLSHSKVSALLRDEIKRDQANPEDEEGVAVCTESVDTRVSSGDSGNPRSLTKTKCGHLFHKGCLLEVKIRKPECPNCRCALTPVSNPQTVPAALEMQSLQPSSMRDAVIHASIRARNAVKRSLELQRMRREQDERAALNRSIAPAIS